MTLDGLVPEIPSLRPVKVSLLGKKERPKEGKIGFIHQGNIGVLIEQSVEQR
jgi:hypothetical protein